MEWLGWEIFGVAAELLKIVQSMSTGATAAMTKGTNYKPTS
jgi:hypothetical protein